MTRRITFLPDGRSCSVEAQETVLEASLRAGMTPVYGCSNGNCGACGATLRSGEIEQVRHHDFAISAEDKAGGRFLMCAHRPVTDIEVEADVSQTAADIPLQDIDTKVKAIDHLDPQVIRLHLQTPRSQRLRFISGQSVTLAVNDEITAEEAIASCPCDDRNLYFHVPLVPDDPFSEYVFSGDLAVRDTVRILGPHKGNFFLNQTEERPSLFISWHTGFAPIISLIEHAMSLEIEEEIHLHRFSPTPGNLYLSNMCRSWSDACDNIHAEQMPQRVTLLSNEEECEKIFTDLAARYTNLPKFDVYVAGPPNFVAAARNVFSEYCDDPAQIRTHTDWLGAIE